MMRFLILAGSTIVAVADAVEQDAEGITTAEGRFPYTSGVTGAQPVAAAMLPDDFAVGRYEWDGKGFVRLPDPPAPPGPPAGPLSQLQFRQLWTFDERLLMDSPEIADGLTPIQRATVKTLMRDLTAASVVQLDHPQVIAGVRAVARLGLISEARAAQILAGQAPA